MQVKCGKFQPLQGKSEILIRARASCPPHPADSRMRMTNPIEIAPRNPSFWGADPDDLAGPVRIRPASAPKHMREPVGKFDSAISPYDYYQGEVPRSVKPSLERKSHGESTQTPLARVNRESKTWLSTLSSPPPVTLSTAREEQPGAFDSNPREKSDSAMSPTIAIWEKSYV